jgi:hypothetical protein
LCTFGGTRGAGARAGLAAAGRFGAGASSGTRLAQAARLPRIAATATALVLKGHPGTAPRFVRDAGRGAERPGAPASTGAVKGRLLMGLILLEVFGALALAVFIVWWTMFSGRPRGERRGTQAPPAEGDSRPPQPPQP